jgi:hypothetical protein
MIRRAYYGISLNADLATPLIRNKIAIIGTNARFGSLATEQTFMDAAQSSVRKRNDNVVQQSSAFVMVWALQTYSRCNK